MPDPAPDLKAFLQKEFERINTDFERIGTDFKFEPLNFKSVEIIQKEDPSVSAEIEVVSIRVPRGREEYWKKRIEEAFDLLDELDDELADERRTEWR